MDYREVCGLIVWVLTVLRLIAAVIGATMEYRMRQALTGDLHRLLKKGANGMQQILIESERRTHLKDCWVLSVFAFFTVLTLARGYRPYEMRGTFDVIAAAIFLGLTVLMAYDPIRKEQLRVRLGALARIHDAD